jgi:hypothetical protein
MRGQITSAVFSLFRCRTLDGSASVLMADFGMVLFGVVRNVYTAVMPLKGLLLAVPCRGHMHYGS